MSTAGLDIDENARGSRKRMHDAIDGMGGGMHDGGGCNAGGGQAGWLMFALAGLVARRRR